jgi:hypothetical protein
MKDCASSVRRAIRDVGVFLLALLTVSTVPPLVLFAGPRFRNGKFWSLEPCTAVVSGTRPLEETVRWGCGRFGEVVDGL